MHPRAAANTLLVCFAEDDFEAAALFSGNVAAAAPTDTSFWQAPDEPEGDEGRRRR